MPTGPPAGFHPGFLPGHGHGPKPTVSGLPSGFPEPTGVPSGFPPSTGTPSGFPEPTGVPSKRPFWSIFGRDTPFRGEHGPGGHGHEGHDHEGPKPTGTISGVPSGFPHPTGYPSGFPYPSGIPSGFPGGDCGGEASVTALPTATPPPSAGAGNGNIPSDMEEFPRIHARQIRPLLV